jgi:hypothetical protein
MKNNQIVMKVCRNCGNGFVLGTGGLYIRGELPLCDTCAGVERDSDGNAWLPGEDQILWEDGSITTRAEAFAK